MTCRWLFNAGDDDHGDCDDCNDHDDHDDKDIYYHDCDYDDNM